MPKFNSSLCWGENYSEFKKSVSWSCINRYCKDRSMVRLICLETFGRIKGVKKAPEKSKNPENIYAIMVQCPSCRTPYWYHANEKYVNFLNRKLGKNFTQT